MSPFLHDATIGPHGIVMLAFTVVVFGLFIRDRIPVATICLGILCLLPLGFALFPLEVSGKAVDPMRFFAGLGHPALVAICMLMVVGHGLVVTGALEPFARRMADTIESKPTLALLILLVVPALASGLVNDTPLVVLLIPLIMAATGRAGVSAAGMLLPMNYAVLIGGMSTTIGTSTNLIVVALAASLGLQPMNLFSFYSLVMLAALPALFYLWLVAPRLLARVKPSDERLVQPVFHAEMHVESGSWLEGRHLREAFTATRHRLRLLDIKRDGQSLARLPSLVLKSGDRMLLQDTVENLKDHESILRAPLHGMDIQAMSAPENPDDNASSLRTDVVAQLIVTPDSPLVGHTVADRRLAEHYGFIVVGLRCSQSNDAWQHENLSHRRLGAGDILLLQGPVEAAQSAQSDGIGFLLDARFALPRQEKAGMAILTIAVVVILAATKVLPIALAALAGALFLVGSRCLSWKDITQALSAKVILLVAASLALGDALDLTGATPFLAARLAGSVQDLSPSTVLILLMGLMGLLTNFVSNNAAAAIGTPLGVELARWLGAPVEPFVLAVLFGCNLCYLTPMGYQTNLLVMNAGGYRFRDFVLVGTPLFVIMWVGLSWGLISRYGL